jgi:hypothetical protein
MKELAQFVLKLALGGLTDEERQLGYKLLTTFGYRLLMVFLMCWAYGVFEIIGGSRGFAHADNVDQKIKTAVEPIVAEQAAQRDLIKGLTTLLNEQLANGIATEIRYLVGKRCVEKDPFERDRIQREIDRKQEEWKRFRGRDESYRYSCGDV